MNQKLKINHRYFLYARKSTDTEDKQARSIDDQLAELRDFARMHGLAVLETFIERRTAKIPGRPIYNSMLTRIENGEADAILAWHPDRLSRNSIDAGRLIYFLDQGIIHDLKFPSYPFDPSSHGKLNLAMAFDFSKYYVDNLGDNVKRAMRQKAKSGILPGRAPLGYLNDPRSKTIVLDPARAPLVRKLFELSATGRWTLLQLRDTLTELGLVSHNEKRLALSEVYRVLQNPFYYGHFRFDGELYEGRHDPIITKTLFDRVHAAMSERSKPRWRPPVSRLYQGVFHCGECGGFFTTETQKGHNYLRCTKKFGFCSQPYLREEQATAQVQDVLKLIILPPDLINGLAAELETRKQEISNTRQDEMLQLRSQIGDLDGKLERLTIAYLDTLVSVDEYRTTKAAVLGQKTLLKEQLSIIEHNPNDWLELMQSFLKDLNQAILVTSRNDPVEQRDFLRKIGSNLTVKNRLVHYGFKSLWNYVATEPQKLDWTTGAPDRRAATPRKSARVFHKGFRPVRDSNVRVLFEGLERMIKNGLSDGAAGLGLERQSALQRNRTLHQRQSSSGLVP